MSDDLRFQVSAGPHPRRGVPLAVAAPPAVAPGPVVLRADTEAIPAQVRGGTLTAVLPGLGAGETRTYRLIAADKPATVSVTPEGARLHVTLGGAPFATLHRDGAPRPFLHPVLAPGGVSVVRGWPVDPGPADSTDHVHHRGAWVAHGDVNGVDAWADASGSTAVGRLVVDECTHTDGCACAEISLALRWLAADGEAVAAERRLHRFWAVDGEVRYIDIESAFGGIAGRPVRFGDTKEGGLVAVRVATGMEGAKTGTIRTAEGASGEAEAWGSAAGWCDYSGTPEGADGQTVGVAIFDHPGNPLAPTRWHVRDYGLMAANPFALAAYMPGRGLRGDWEIPGGGTATFRHRLVLHRGDAACAEIAARYADWAFPPRVRWLPA